MKALFAGLAMYSAVSAAQAQDQKDHVVFLGTMSEEAWSKYEPVPDFAKDPKYAGQDIAYFGVTVNGLFNREAWHWTTCKDLLATNGDRAWDSMSQVLENRNTVQMFSPFENITNEPVDLESMRRSVDGAVNKAIDACRPHIG